ncbi:MAG: VCBS repeat-containing protein [Nitrospinaceae bacterium]|jgi:hypothetical protein|nr:VCBS repeat-containing protein [Nitrospinaceae bacterium]
MLSWVVALASATAVISAEQKPFALGQAAARPGFRLIDPSQSGATFRNEISVGDAAANQVLLNGSGVAAGDYDRDGLPDLYFCGLENNSILYRNLGQFRFQPVSEHSRLAKRSGVSAARHPGGSKAKGQARPLQKQRERPWPSVTKHPAERRQSLATVKQEKNESYFE